VIAILKLETLNSKLKMTGHIYFIGAGPGDPDLLTLKAQKIIATADVVIYAGSLVNPAILAHARPNAEIHNSAGLNLTAQIEIMRAAAAQGKTVARLHTGDPTLYGATMEQMRALERLAIPYSVVPGVSSAFAATAALKTELTAPGQTQTVIFTRMPGRTPVPDAERLRDLAAHHTSIVLFLSTGMIAQVVDELLAAGYSPHTPIAVVYRAGWDDELVLRGTLKTITARTEAAEITHQALIIVSPVLGKDSPAINSHLYGTAFTPPSRTDRPAIVTLTRRGTETGLRLHRLLADSRLYAPARFLPADQSADTTGYTVSVRQVLHDAFRRHSAMICIMASGIVVRELAPLLRSKHTDPAVVVLDEQGRNAISLLSGHKGGANFLAQRIAHLLGGRAVLTTASDGQQLPPLDLLGEKYGWQLESGEDMTAVIAALVNGETVGIFQDNGDETWLTDLPPHATRYPTVEALIAARPNAAVIISPRILPAELHRAIPRIIVYRPPVLAVGVGCNRGTPADDIIAAVEKTLMQAGLSPLSIATVATIDAKADEAGLLAACRQKNWRLQIFTRAEISTVEDLPNPSPWAMKSLGVPGVAEPAALLAAETKTLLIEKQKFTNVTVAVARRAMKI